MCVSNMKRSYHQFCLPAILLLAVVLRFIWFREMYADPAAALPVQDAEYHHYWANGLATGNWTPPESYADPEIQTTPYFRPPGYPYFLGLIYKIFGAKVLAGVAVQLLLGLLNVWLVFLAGKKLFSDASGLIAAFLAAAWWVFIFSEGTLLDPTLHITFLLLTLLALLRHKDAAGITETFWLIMSGLLLGITCLIRPTTLLMIPVCAIWIAWTRKDHRIRTAVILIIAAIAAIAPVTIRNYVKGHDRVLISSNAGLMFYMGNSEESTGFTGTTALNELQSGKYRSCFDYAVFVKKLGLRENRPMKHSEASAFLMARTLEIIRKNPLQFLSRTGERLLHYMRPAEISHNHEMHFARQNSPLLRNLPGSFSLILALSLTGLVLCLRSGQQKSGFVLVALFIAVHFATLIPFVFSSQYRIAVLPLMMLLAGIALHDIGSKIIARNTRAALPSIIGATAIYLASAWGAAAPPTLLQWHYQQAAAYERLGRPDDAIRHYRSMIQLDPNSAWAHGALGRHYAEQGRVREAVTHLIKAVELNPDYPRARSQLGSILYLAGHKTEGMAELRKVLSNDPDDVSALNSLAWILATDNDPSIRNPIEAVRLSEKACELTARQSASLLDTLAAAYDASGEKDKSVRTAEEALAIARKTGERKLEAEITKRLGNYRR